MQIQIEQQSVKPDWGIRHRVLDLRNRLKWALWNLGARGRRNLSRLLSSAGSHKGSRCFIIGNGPSLNQMNLDCLEGEVTIACNSFFLMYDRIQWRPTYYTVEDTLVAADRAEALAQLHGSNRVFPFDLQGLLNMPGSEDVLWVNFRRFYQSFPRFSDQIAEVAFWGGTVTFLNLQLAFHLGCNPIYLIGVDHNYNTAMAVEKRGNVWKSEADDVNHFDPNYFGKGYRWHDPNVARMEAAYRVARRFADSREVSVINATCGGRLEVFERRNYDSLFPQ